MAHRSVELLLHSDFPDRDDFETTWNKFDFFIVMASLLDMLLAWTPTEGNEALSVGP
jgi:hypothetical protein